MLLQFMCCYIIIIWVVFNINDVQRCGGLVFWMHKCFSVRTCQLSSEQTASVLLVYSCLLGFMLIKVECARLWMQSSVQHTFITRDPVVSLHRTSQSLYNDDDNKEFATKNKQAQSNAFLCFYVLSPGCPDSLGIIFCNNSAPALPASFIPSPPPCLAVWLLDARFMSLKKIHGVLQLSLVLSLPPVKRHGRKLAMTEEGCDSKDEALDPLRTGQLAATPSLVITVTHTAHQMTMVLWSDLLQS